MVAELTKEFYTAQEIQDRYGWSDYQLRSQIKRGAFPNIVGDGQGRRFSKSDIEALDSGKVGVTTPEPEAKTVSLEMQALLDRQKSAIKEKEVLDVEAQTLESERKLAEEKKLRDLPDVLRSKGQELNAKALDLESREETVRLGGEALATQKMELLELNSTLKTKELELEERIKRFNDDCLTKQSEVDTYCETKMNELSAQLETSLNDNNAVCTKKLNDIETEANKRIKQVNDWSKAANEEVSKIQLAKLRWLGATTNNKSIDTAEEQITQWLNWIAKYTTVTQIKEMFSNQDTRRDFLLTIKSVSDAVKATRKACSDLSIVPSKIPSLKEFEPIPLPISGVQTPVVEIKESEVKESENN